jgi:hypothetical protein
MSVLAINASQDADSEFSVSEGIVAKAEKDQVKINKRVNKLAPQQCQPSTCLTAEPAQTLLYPLSCRRRKQTDGCSDGGTALPYFGCPPFPKQKHMWYANCVVVQKYRILAYMLASSASFLLSRSTSASRATFAISIWRMLEINSVHFFSNDVNWFPIRVLNGNKSEY